jgi:tRNA(Ile)-lysidine synthase
MNLLEAFQHNIDEQGLFKRTDRLLLAVSGGVDSVVLCELCFRAGYDFVMAHCNFQLRQEESERDQKFAQALAGRYGKTLLVKKFDTTTYANENKVSIQVAARELRYSWFYELLSENNPAATQSLSCLLTAHHADDNVETVLMNFFKGSGIGGLKGIAAKQGKIIRPLLPFRKEELLLFAEIHNLSWVEDSSNLSDKYTRNYFRRQIIPMVEKVFPSATENVLGNIRRLSDAALLYEQAIAMHKKKLLEAKGNEVHIPVLKLLRAQPLATIVYEIINDYNFTPAQTNEVIKLLHSESGRYVSSATHRVIRNRNWLIIAPVAAKSAGTILIENENSVIELEGMRIEMLLAAPPQKSNDVLVAELDASHIRFPLLLRKWKAGDYFYPLGMKKKKKLARFFIDQKLSKSDKENTWIIESDRKILWVIGQRIDDRFRVTEKTKQVLRITCQRG